MKYFKKENGNIVKYEVTFDRSKIKELRKMIIDSCGEVKYKNYDCAEEDIDILKNCERVRELKIRRNGLYKHEQGPDVPKYRVSYYEIEYPILVDYIDRLLKDDATVLKEIEDYKIELPLKEELNRKIDKLKKELDFVDDIKKKLNIIEEMEKLYKKLELNYNQSSTEIYYRFLIDLLDFKRLDEMSIQTLRDFFENNEETLKLILK